MPERSLRIAVIAEHVHRQYPRREREYTPGLVSQPVKHVPSNMDGNALPFSHPPLSL